LEFGTQRLSESIFRQRENGCGAQRATRLDPAEVDQTSPRG
jgi:hypothetical protein